MHYGSSLAATGVGLTIGGIVFGQTELIGIAGGLVLAGALIVRYTFRRNKTMKDV